MVRLVILLAFGLNCAVAAAALTCEQLANVAYATQQLRDQGNSLADVLADADRLKETDKLNDQDLERVRDIVGEAFSGGSSMPIEFLRECKDKRRR